jgi:hypothetical protein
MVKGRMLIEKKGQDKMKDLIQEGEGCGTRRKIARDLKKCDELKNYFTPGSGVLLEHLILI